MSTIDISNNNTNSTTLELENLQQKYSNVLLQYQQAVADYISYLNIEAQQPCLNFSADSKNIDQKCYDYIWKKAGCNTTGVVNANTSWAQSQTLNGLIYDSFLWATLTDNTHRQSCYGTSTKYSTATEPNYKINNNPLTSIQGMSYVGTGTAGQSTATTLQTCQASCSQNTNCTGATFVSGKCNLRTGDSPIMPASYDSYAIVPAQKKLLMNMDHLNQQLLTINTELQTKIKASQTIYYQIEGDVNNEYKNLIQTYGQLELDRENILELIKQYETLDSTENENQIIITKNYYTYVLLVILVIAIIALLVKMSMSGSTAPTVQTGGQLNSSAYYIVFIMVSLIIVINFSIKYFSL